MTHRIANEADLESLVRLRLAMRRERDPDTDLGTLAPATRDFFQRNLATGAHVAFLCEEDGAIIATAGLTLFEMPPTAKLPNGRVAKLMNMYVVPAQRRRGVAQALLRFVADHAAAHGYHKIMLNSSPMGEALYRSFGFTRITNEFECYLP